MQLETPIDTVSAFARSARDRGVNVMLNAAPAAPCRRRCSRRLTCSW